MKFARLGVVTLPLVLSIAAASCSDPPSPPAQAAVTLTTEPAPGLVCTTTHGQLSMPDKYNTSVYTELNCDLSMGCKPDEYVVVDRDRGATVTCTVAQTASGYTVSASMDVDSAGSGIQMQFSITGALTATGGTAAVYETNSVGGGGGSQQDCTITIASPFGIIAKGKIWGQFQCDKFRDEHNIGDTGCLLKGKFLFENCSS